MAASFSVPVASGYACAVSLTSAHADGAASRSSVNSRVKSEKIKENFSCNS